MGRDLLADEPSTGRDLLGDSSEVASVSAGRDLLGETPSPAGRDLLAAPSPAISKAPSNEFDWAKDVGDWTAPPPTGNFVEPSGTRVGGQNRMVSPAVSAAMDANIAREKAADNQTRLAQVAATPKVHVDSNAAFESVAQPIDQQLTADFEAGQKELESKIAANGPPDIGPWVGYDQSDPTAHLGSQLSTQDVENITTGQVPYDPMSHARGVAAWEQRQNIAIADGGEEPKTKSEAARRFDMLPIRDGTKMSIENMARTLIGESTNVNPEDVPYKRGAVADLALGPVRYGMNLMESASRGVSTAVAPKDGVLETMRGVSDQLWAMRDATRASDSLGTGMGYAVQIGEVIPQVAAQVVLSGLGSGGFVAGSVVPLMVQSYDQTYTMLLENGGGESDSMAWAFANSLGKGLITAISSKMEFNVLGSSSFAKKLARKHIAAKFMARVALGGGAESIQEFTENMLQEIPEAITRAMNNMEGRTFDEAFDEALQAASVGFGAGAGMGVFIHPDTQARVEAVKKKYAERTAKLRQMAAEQASNGNAVAAQTIEGQIAREEQQGANEQQQAIADIQAQQSAILEELKAEAGSIDDRVAAAEEATKAAQEESQAAQEATLKEGDKQAKQAEEARKRDLESRRRTEQTRVDEAKLEQLRQKADAEEAKARGEVATPEETPLESIPQAEVPTSIPETETSVAGLASAKASTAILTKPGESPNTFNGQPLAEVETPSGKPVTDKFFTEQGSEYIITEAGEVRRVKSEHSNTGGEDVGLHDWSGNSAFVDEHVALSAGKAAEKYGHRNVRLESKDGTLTVMIRASDGNFYPATYGQVYGNKNNPELNATYAKALQDRWGVNQGDVIASEASATPKVGKNILDWDVREDGSLTGVHPGSKVSHVEAKSTPTASNETKPSRPISSQPEVSQQPTETLPEEGKVSGKRDAGVPGVAGLAPPKAEGGVAPKPKVEAAEKAVGDAKEAKAIAIGNSPAALKKRIQNAIAMLTDKDLASSFRNGTFDFDNKRIVSSDGKHALQWQLRNDPSKPEGYNNQQTNSGDVSVVAIQQGQQSSPSVSPKETVSPSSEKAVGSESAGPTKVEVTRKSEPKTVKDHVADIVSGKWTIEQLRGDVPMPADLMEAVNAIGMERYEQAMTKFAKASTQKDVTSEKPKSVAGLPSGSVRVFHHSSEQVGEFSGEGVYLTTNEHGYARRPKSKFNNPRVLNVSGLKLANKAQATKAGRYQGNHAAYIKNLKDAGFDGAKYTEDGDTTYFIIDPKNIVDPSEKATPKAVGSESAGQNTPKPFSATNLQEAFGISEEEAAAVVALAEAMGLDASKIVIAKGGKAGEGAMFQPAWHGSPHTFDKFTTQKMGSGEGAQAYGWGMYFAGKKEVAEYYKSALAKGEELVIEYPNGKTVKGDDLTSADLELAKYWEIATQKATYPHLVEYTFNKIASESAKARLKDVGAFPKFVGYVKQKGRLYKVELAPQADEYLLWDKPLSEQSEKVKKAVGYDDKSAAKYDDALLAELEGRDVGEKPKEPISFNSGDELYRSLVRQFGSDQAASSRLHSLGIRGIKYLDGSSRGDGDGTYNYVIFSDDDVAIEAMFQGEKASVEFIENGKALIRALEKPDVSSGVHEIAHVARRFLLNRDVPAGQREGITDKEIEVAEKWAGAKDGKWDTSAEEKFARGFERYLRDGNAPAPILKSLFAKFKSWLKGIYTKLAGSPIDIKISPEMREVFDKLVTRNIKDGQKTSPTPKAVGSETPAEVSSGVEGKQPWEMARGEFVAATKDSFIGINGGRSVMGVRLPNGAIVQISKSDQRAGKLLRSPEEILGDVHRDIVKQQNAEAKLHEAGLPSRSSKPVPAEVLADYPDLQPKASETPPPKSPISKQEVAVGDVVILRGFESKGESTVLRVLSDGKLVFKYADGKKSGPLDRSVVKSVVSAAADTKASSEPLGNLIKKVQDAKKKLDQSMKDDFSSGKMNLSAGLDPRMAKWLGLHAVEMSLRLGNAAIKGGKDIKARFNKMFDDAMQTLRNNGLNTEDLESKRNTIWKRTREIRKIIAPDGTVDMNKVNELVAGKQDLLAAMRAGLKQGREEAREEARVKIEAIRLQAKTKEEFGKAQRREAARLIKSIVKPGEVRKEWLNSLATIKDAKGVNNLMDRVAAYLDKAQHRKLVNQAARMMRGRIKGSKRLRAEYKAQMDALFAGLDASKMTKHTKVKLDGIKRFLDNLSTDEELELKETGMYDKLLATTARLDNKPLVDLTSDQLRSLIDAANTIVSMNLLKNKLILNGRRRDAKKAIDSSIQDVNERAEQLKSDELLREEGQAPRTMVARIRAWVNKFSYNANSTDSITTAIAGEDSQLNKLLYKDFVKASDDFYRVDREGRDVIDSVRERHEITEGDMLDWMNESQELTLASSKKITLTNAERISIVLNARNQDTLDLMVREGIKKASNRGLDNTTEMLTYGDIASLSPQSPFEVDLADSMMGYLNGSLKGQLGKVSTQIRFYNQFEVDNYFPRIRDRQQSSGEDSGLINTMFGEGWLENRGFTKERTGGTGAVLFDNVLNTYFQHVEDSARYVAYAIPVRNARMVISNENLRSAINKRYGQNFVNDQFMSFLKDISGNPMESQIPWEKAVGFVTRNTGMMLALRPSTIFNNGIGAPLGMAAEMPMSLWPAYFLELTSGRGVVDKGFYEREIAPYSHTLFKRYSGDPYNLMSHGDARLHGDLAKNKAMMRWRRLQQATMRPMASAEKYGVIAAYRVMWNDAKSKNPKATDAEIRAKLMPEFETMVRRSQNPIDENDMGSFSRQIRRKPLLRLGFQFTSQVMKIRDQMIRVLHSDMGYAEKTARMGMLLASTTAVPAMATALANILYRGFQEEDEEYKDTIAEKLYGLAENASDVIHPIIGMFSRTIRGPIMNKPVMVSRTPTSAMIAKTIRGAAEFVSGLRSLDDDEYVSGQKLPHEKIWSGVGDFLVGFSTLAVGAPVDAPYRMAEGFFKWAGGTPIDFELHQNLTVLRRQERDKTITPKHKLLLDRLEAFNRSMVRIRRAAYEDKITEKDANEKLENLSNNTKRIIETYQFKR